MKNNKGITLIALVVTIIVLLILAGVSIAMLTGDNGILKNAKKADKDTAVANAKESIAMVVNEAITDYYKSAYAESNSTVQGHGIAYAVLTALSGISANEFDGITYTPPTAPSATLTADDSTTKIKYNADNDEYVLTVDKDDGKISWNK